MTKAAGLALVALDTGRVLMLQRYLDPEDVNGGTWEFPGGKVEEEDADDEETACREWEEEVGQPLPDDFEVVSSWWSPDGETYQGFIGTTSTEKNVVLHAGRAVDNPDDPNTLEAEQAAWWEIKDAAENPALRPECNDAPWEEIEMAGAPLVKSSSLYRFEDYDAYNVLDSIFV